MTLWNVTAHTLRIVGDQEVCGTQTWVVQARRSVEAVRQVIARAAGEDAVRHRRGAVLDSTAFTTTRWVSPHGSLGPTVPCPPAPRAGSRGVGEAENQVEGDRTGLAAAATRNR